MKKMFCLLVILLQAFFAISYCEPMEPYKNYNVILVHGAGGRYFGLDCDNDSKLYGAWTYLSKRDREASNKDERNDYLELTGGYGEKLFGTKRESSAEDMDKKNSDDEHDGLRHWLTEKIFDDDKSVAYLQRPFTNPANSPVNNARELGDPKWKGDKKCSERRSLIEEAQEVRAKGRENLKNYRTNPKYYYEDSLLPPTRNILIAHSMGGVASREYVQGENYNEDVDKVITSLDSLHDKMEFLC